MSILEKTSFSIQEKLQNFNIADQVELQWNKDDQGLNVQGLTKDAVGENIFTIKPTDMTF